MDRPARVVTGPVVENGKTVARARVVMAGLGLPVAVRRSVVVRDVRQTGRSASVRKDALVTLFR